MCFYKEYIYAYSKKFAIFKYDDGSLVFKSDFDFEKRLIFNMYVILNIIAHVLVVIFQNMLLMNFSKDNHIKIVGPITLFLVLKYFYIRYVQSFYTN